MDASGLRVTRDLKNGIADLDFYRQMYSAGAEHGLLKPPDMVSTRQRCTPRVVLHMAGGNGC